MLSRKHFYQRLEIGTCIVNCVSFFQSPRTFEGQEASAHSVGERLCEANIQSMKTAWHAASRLALISVAA